MSIAIIGGSGLSQLPELVIKDEEKLDTPCRKPYANKINGKLNILCNFIYSTISVENYHLTVDNMV